MNDEERQRTMDFILQQQAQFTVGMQKLEEQQAQLTEQQSQLTEQQSQFAGQQAQLSAEVQGVNASVKQLRRVVVLMTRRFQRERDDLHERVAALVDAQVKSEDKASHTEDVLERLGESHARSDERMTRVEESQARSEERLTRLEELTGRNSEDIAALAKVVANMARGRNGDEGAA